MNGTLLLCARDPNKAHLWRSDFCKFVAQFGDTVGWDRGQKYAVALEMIGFDCAYYKHLLSDDVYDTYMRLARYSTLTTLRPKESATSVDILARTLSKPLKQTD